MLIIVGTRGIVVMFSISAVICDGFDLSRDNALGLKCQHRKLTMLSIDSTGNWPNNLSMKQAYLNQIIKCT